jgi:hypothetical protein
MDGLSGYFGCLGPELDEWITTELAAPQLVVTEQRTYEAVAGLPDEARDESGMTQLYKVVFSRTMGSLSLAPRAHERQLGGSAAVNDLSPDRGDAGREAFFADMASADP